MIEPNRYKHQNINPFKADFRFGCFFTNDIVSEKKHLKKNDIYGRNISVQLNKKEYLKNFVHYFGYFCPVFIVNSRL